MITRKGSINIFSLQLLRLIHCSLGGLPESEVRCMLDLSSEEGLSMLTWSTVRRHLKPFLRSAIFWYNGALRMQFFHASMSQVRPSVDW